MNKVNGIKRKESAPKVQTERFGNLPLYFYFEYDNTLYIKVEHELCVLIGTQVTERFNMDDAVVVVHINFNN